MGVVVLLLVCVWGVWFWLVVVVSFIVSVLFNRSTYGFPTPKRRYRAFSRPSPCLSVRRLRMPRTKNLTLATARLWSPCLPSQLGEQVGEKHKAEEAGSEDPLLWGR